MRQTCTCDSFSTFTRVSGHTQQIDMVLLYVIKKKIVAPTEMLFYGAAGSRGLQSGGCLLPNQQADDCGRDIARSFLRAPFMCAYGGRSSREGRAVTPDPAPDIPLAACWLEGCLSMAAVDVQGEEGELVASEGVGGASALGEGGVCWSVRACCICVEDGVSTGTSSGSSSLSARRCEASTGLLSAL